MSPRRVELTPEAILELEDASTWYQDRSPRAAEAFARSLDHAIELLATNPEIAPRSFAGTRRHPLSKFPYDIHYRLEPSRLVILAIAHQKRRPRYWIRRLGSE